MTTRELVELIISISELETNENGVLKKRLAEMKEKADKSVCQA